MSTHPNHHANTTTRTHIFSPPATALSPCRQDDAVPSLTELVAAKAELLVTPMPNPDKILELAWLAGQGRPPPPQSGPKPGRLAEADAGGPGAAAACTAVGFAYRDGRGGVVVDLARAAWYFARAAALGHAKAAYTAGSLHQHGGPGLPSPPDYGLAAEFYKRAIELGDTDARLNLSILYEKGGAGLDKDLAKCHALRTVGADAGEAACQLQVSEDFEEGKNGAGGVDAVAAVNYGLQAAANPQTATIKYSNGTTGADKAAAAVERLRPAAQKAAAAMLRRIRNLPATGAMRDAQREVMNQYFAGTLAGSDRTAPAYLAFKELANAEYAPLPVSPSSLGGRAAPHPSPSFARLNLLRVAQAPCARIANPRI